uniref:BOD1/SHG1 domain-containing protein n=1 Tax=Varanus komodoensis TaxID=61221 RepID=A0A8D2L5M7_VARKO
EASVSQCAVGRSDAKCCATAAPRSSSPAALAAPLLLRTGAATARSSGGRGSGGTVLVARRAALRGAHRGHGGAGRDIVRYGRSRRELRGVRRDRPSIVAPWRRATHRADRGAAQEPRPLRRLPQRLPGRRRHQAYQNLRQKVDNFVSTHLDKQEWNPTMNKNQLRNGLRQSVIQSGMLEAGVDRIISQVVDPKLNHIFRPQIEKAIHDFLAAQKKEDSVPAPPPEPESQDPPAPSQDAS